MSYMPARYFTLSHEPWDHFLVQFSPRGRHSSWHSRVRGVDIPLDLGGIPTSNLALLYCNGMPPTCRDHISCDLFPLEAKHAGKPVSMSKGGKGPPQSAVALLDCDRDKVVRHKALTGNLVPYRMAILVALLKGRKRVVRWHARNRRLGGLA